MKLDKETIGAWSTERLFYLSSSWINRDNFGHCRLQRDILRAWMERKLEFGGQHFQTTPPELTQEEIRSVPGGEASMGSLDSLRWETLERSGTKLCIKQDEHRYWASQTGEIAETYAKLKSHHDQLAEQLAGSDPSSANGGAGADGASSQPQTEQEECCSDEILRLVITY